MAESALTLPGMPEPPPPAPVGPTRSAGQRLTERLAQDVRDGRHPLTRGPLHRFASPETCTPTAARNVPFTCGSCRFRELIRWHDNTYPKCVRDLARADQDAAALADRTLDTAAYITHGTATDVRRWWPACTHYEAGDQALSPDASRRIP
jgi:hypothetical protein